MSHSTPSPHSQRVPLLNPNDLQAEVVDVRVRPGDAVREGDLLCALQTTKAAFDVLAEADGWVHEMRAREGGVVTAGELLCVIGSTPPAEGAAPTDASTAASPAEPDLRLTKPARALAERLGIAIERLPRGVLVTEDVVRSLAPSADGPAPARESAVPARTEVIIFGGGGHALALIDILRQTRALEPYGIVDDGSPSVEALGVPLLGTRAALPRLRDEGFCLALNAVGAVGNMGIRLSVFEALRSSGFAFPSIVHPRAVIEPSARLAAGCQVFALAYVGSAVSVGFGSIINTSSVLSHDCVIGDCCHIAPGALLAGGVKVGDGTLVGSGVTTDLRVTIGRHARIGNGACILADVPDRAIVPVGATWTEASARAHRERGE